VRLFGAIFSAARYCPQTKNSSPLFFISAIVFRFGLLVPNLPAIVIRDAATISKTIATATQGNCKISAIYLLRGFAELALQHFKTQLLQVFHNGFPRLAAQK